MAEPNEGKALGKLQRTVEISGILYRNDFFGMMRDIARAERVPGEPGQGRRIEIPPDVPQKVRKMLEELGPTFIKLGQLLGTRPDLVPKSFIDEFKHLYDKTTPTPYAEVRALIEHELGQSVEKVFSRFDEEPIASASVGQVHFATLRTGEKVAVKVQHPGIQERVAVDFEIMEPMVRFIENLFAASRVWQPRDHLLEIYQMLLLELDYRNEARNVQRVYESFKNDPTVKIPRVYWEASSGRVLTLERIDGVKLSDFESPELKALDGKRLARIITHAMARQIFEDRFFHADPSPGNLKALDSGTVAFLDWGAVGIVTRRRSEHILALIMGFVRHDTEAVAEALIALASHQGDLDTTAFMRDVERMMEYHEQTRASVADPVVLEMTLNVANKHQMLLPPDFMLITRALFQFEGLCKKLDPDFELVEVLQPYVVTFLRRETFSMHAQKEAVIASAIDTLDIMRTFPTRLNKVLRKIENNDLRVRVDLAQGPKRDERDERRNLRSMFSILVGALILGTAWIMASGQTAALVPFLFAAILFLLLWAFIILYWSD